MKMERLAAFSILASNILFIFASYVLRAGGLSVGNTLLALGVANVICGLGVLFLYRRQQASFGVEDVLLLVFRSLAFVFTYWLFVFWKNLITVPDLIVAETAAPFLSMYIAGKLLRIGTQPATKISQIDLLKLFLLITIPIINSSMVQTWSNPRWPLLGLITLLFIVNQTTSRMLSKRVPIQWTIGRSTTLSGAALIFTGFFLSPSIGSFSNLVAFKAFELSGLILLIQILFLYGLKYCPGKLAAFSISTSVPLSILYSLAIGENAVRPAAVAIGLVYCFMIFINPETDEASEPDYESKSSA